MQLGKFIKDDAGHYHGKVSSYGLPEATIILTPQVSKKGEAYFSVTGDPTHTAFDGGVAYPKKKGNLEYLTVVLDSPMFPAPVYAALFQDKTNSETYNLIWDRPEAKADLNQENVIATLAVHTPPAAKATNRGPSLTA